jgi:acetyl-CoA carboxylase biotin carboxyl carrier protein
MSANNGTSEARTGVGQSAGQPAGAHPPSAAPLSGHASGHTSGHGAGHTPGHAAAHGHPPGHAPGQGPSGHPGKRTLHHAPGAVAASEPAVAHPAEPGEARMPVRFRLAAGDTVIEIEWSAAPVPAAAPAAAAAAPVEVARVVEAAPVREAAGAVEPASDGLQFVRAPMVGTFYHAADPGAQPFVRVGDEVRPGQTIGILEVMKMMNPITADVAGRVVEFAATDGQSVEFEQPLVAVLPGADGG